MIAEPSENQTSSLVDLLLLPYIKTEQQVSSKVDPLLISSITEEEAEFPAVNEFGAANAIGTIANLEVDLFTCKMCKKTCESQDVLNQHFRTHACVVRIERISVQDLLPRYTCDTCDKYFDGKVTLAKHLLLHSVALPDVNEHNDVSRKQISYKSDCGKSGTLHRNQSQSSNKTAKRKICKAKFKTSGHFVCNECGKKLCLKSSLKRHTLVHSDDSGKTFRCIVETCIKSFKTKSELKSHETVHVNKKPFACDICDFHCKRPEGLKAHMQVHSADDQVRFHCADCGKVLKTKNNLRLHMLVHSGNRSRSFVCNEGSCKKSYYSKQDSTLR